MLKKFVLHNVAVWLNFAFIMIFSGLKKIKKITKMSQNENWRSHKKIIHEAQTVSEKNIQPF